MELRDVLELRVRYGETDQMGTFYNARALDWFECGRSELMRRHMDMTYADMESRGVFLPLVEAHLEFLGRARYDDLLRITSVVRVFNRARLRFDVSIDHPDSGRGVVNGWTMHAFTDSQGRPMRPPGFFVAMLEKAAARQRPT